MKKNDMQSLRISISIWVRDMNINPKYEHDVQSVTSALHARCFLFVSNKNTDRITKRHEIATDDKSSV